MRWDGSELGVGCRWGGRTNSRSKEARVQGEEGRITFELGEVHEMHCEAHRDGNGVACSNEAFCVFPAVTVRSQRATGIGRLMVNVVEGIELKPCRSHGKALRHPPLLP